MEQAREPLDRLVAQTYQELRRIAHRHLARGQRGTLDTTALVHEAYLRLAGNQGSWRDASHFRAIASVAMRHVLVDRARSRATTRHGGGLTRTALDEGSLASDDSPDTLLAIDAALDQLGAVAPRLARMVILRFYGGMSDQEIAEETGVTPRTVQRDWAKARVLLLRALES